MLERIRDSRLVEWLIAYLAFAWLVLQIVALIAEVWGLSDVFQKRTHVALAFGVPATAVIAWFHGEKGSQQVTRGELLALAALSGLAALAIPSVGVAGPETVLGIPPSIVVPGTLVTMLAIPVSLIVMSVRKREIQPEPTTDDDPPDCLNEIEDALLEELVSAESPQQVAETRQVIDRLSAIKPDSVGLAYLKSMADKIAMRVSASESGTTDKNGQSEIVPDEKFEGSRTVDEGSPTVKDAAGPAVSQVARRVGQELRDRNVTKAATTYVGIVVIVSLLWSVSFNFLGYPLASQSALTLPYPPISVAILPFASSDDLALAGVFADELAEDVADIIDSVAGQDLRIARYSVLFFSDTRTSEPSLESELEFAKQLGAEFAVGGSVRTEGDRIQVSAHVLRASDGSVLWSAPNDLFVFDEMLTLADLSAVSVTIADAAVSTIADSLAVPDSPDEVVPVYSADDVLGYMVMIMVVFGFSVSIVFFWHHGRRRKTQRA